MKTVASVNQVPFQQVINLFIKRAENRYILPSYIGKGYLQIFELEKGLQARCWDCCFKERIEMYSDVIPTVDRCYFTLVLFLDTEGLQFAEKGMFMPRHIVWDTLFISASSDYTLNFDPMVRSRCLAICFSNSWLSNNVFSGNGAFNSLKEKINSTASFSLLESMNISEKKMIEELLLASWHKPLGSFCIKSAVLKIISDFFNKLKEKYFVDSNNSSLATAIAEIEKYLCDHVLSALPNLEDLSEKFGISASTLKRHFKKRFGVNMSTYFIRKKMEYAQHLIDEKNICVDNTATIVGYKNVHNFMAIYRKHAQHVEKCV